MRPPEGQLLCRKHEDVGAGRLDRVIRSDDTAASEGYEPSGDYTDRLPSLRELYPQIDDIDAATTAGQRAILGYAVKALCSLPFTIKTANSFSQLGTTMRGVIEQSEVIDRMDAIEARLNGEADE